MNYLFRYLSALKPDEIQRLEQLDASPREREVLDLLLELRGNVKATKAEATERLGMSGSMFDKTCSRMLRAILDESNAGGIELLEHLTERSVYDLFLHELRRQERECLATGNRADVTRFYGEAVRVLHLRFSSDYPERYARQIVAKYLRLNPSPDAVIFAEACLAGMAIWVEASRRTGDATRARLEKQLRRNDARITEHTGAQARFRQLKAWIIFYGQLLRNPECRMACLRQAAELCDQHPGVLTRLDKALTLCQIAEEHYFYRTDLVTPLAMYRDIYSQYSDVLQREEYHTFKIIQLCLINGEYSEAENLLLRYFGTDANFVVQGGGRSKDVALYWTKLFVLTGKLDEARGHLDDAVLLNQKGFYLQYEVECRMLHTAICFLEGDFDLVERRLPAHIKYLRSKGVTYATSRYYPWFFKLASALIDERTTGKKLSPKLEKKMEDFMEGAAAQYGVLLRKMRAA